MPSAGACLISALPLTMTIRPVRLRTRSINWFTSADYSQQQCDFLSRRQEGTGQWLLDSDNFQRWLSEAGLTMFCPGIPGGGKTVITSTVVDHLQTKFAKDPHVGVAFAYCNFRQTTEQSARDLLTSILRQLLCQLSDVPRAVAKVYDKRRMNGMTLAVFRDLIKCLSATLSSFSRSFILIDALDESQVSNDGRDRFLTELFMLQEKTLLSLFATSRFMPDIQTKFKGSLTTEIRGHEEDVRMYLTSSISILRLFVQRDAELQKEIMDAVSGAVDGM